MRIYLLRHGRAEVGFGKPDADRALTEEGWAKLRRAAPAWGRLMQDVEVVVTSPFLRARETASVLIEALPGEPEVRIEDALTPAGDPTAALDLVTSEAAAGTASLAFVGHEPHLGDLLGLLLTGDGQHSIPLKKGMLVGIELASSASLVGSLVFALGQRAAGDLA